MICGAIYEQFRHIVKTKQLPNIPLTVDDVDAAEDIFGKSLQYLKGKTTRRQSLHMKGGVASLTPEILEQYREVILSTDVISVNFLKLFITKSRHINCTTVELLGSNKTETLLKSILNVAFMYQARGFCIKEAHMDGKFECLRTPLQVNHIHANICSESEHIGKI